MVENIGNIARPIQTCSGSGNRGRPLSYLSKRRVEYRRDWELRGGENSANKGAISLDFKRIPDRLAKERRNALVGESTRATWFHNNRKGC